MILDVVFILIILQGLLGAFDTLYHHELLLGLPWRSTAKRELLLHSVRNFIYVVVFFSLAWTQWHGNYIWILLAMLLFEIVLTLWDFLEEDKTRILPGTERLTHTLLTLNYGLILAFLTPTFWAWASNNTEFRFISNGYYSWVLSLFALGVMLWAVRDLLAARRLSQIEKKIVDTSGLQLNKAQSRILITGGSGYIGRQFAQKLINEGHYVTILTRNFHTSAIHFKGSVRLIDNLDCLPDTEVVDVVLNLAGASIAGSLWTKKYRQTLLDSRLSITNQLLKLCSRLNQKPDVCISASAIGYYGDQGDRICDETQDGDSSFSSHLCEQWEDAAAKIETIGIRLCILRFGVVLGRNGGALAKMLMPFEIGAGGMIAGGKQWFSWIHLDDLHRLFVFCINNDNVKGVYNATAPDPVRNKGFTDVVSRVLKRPARIPLPGFVVKTLLGQMGQELFLFSTRVSSDKVQLDGFVFHYHDIESALKQIVTGALPAVAEISTVEI